MQKSPVAKILDCAAEQRPAILPGSKRVQEDPEAIPQEGVLRTLDANERFDGLLINAEFVTGKLACSLKLVVNPDYVDEIGWGW